jgi:hypothetical protein
VSPEQLAAIKSNKTGTDFVTATTCENLLHKKKFDRFSNRQEDRYGIVASNFLGKFLD